MSTTLISDASWVIGWDEDKKRHVYRQDIDLAFSGETIIHVGQNFGGAADATIDGQGLMALPGLVDIHSHPSHEPAYRGIREEHGVANMYMTGLYERSQAFDTSDRELRLAAVEVALCELLKSGVTSVCDISPLYEGWIETFARSGMRGFLAPGFACARWKLDNDHTLGFDWDEARGRNGMEEALDFIDGLAKHPSGRLSGVVSPMQIENCSDDLLRDSLVAESGCSVAHCPTPFARYGHVMESFGDYVRAGVTMGFGTDTTPHNMLEEIRKAGTFARIAARDLNNVSTAMLFHAATAGGAKALLRDDIGRLAPGAKADIVLVDLRHPNMMLARDPLRSLVFHAADRAVKDVYVAGRRIVADGAVTTLDHRAAAERLSEAQKRMMALTPYRDYRGRTADEIAPLSLPII